MFTPLLREFLAHAHDGMADDAIAVEHAVIIHLTPNVSSIVRDGFLTGETDFRRLVASARSASDDDSSNAPGLSLGYSEDAIHEIARRLSEGSAEAAVVVAPAVRLGLRFVFDGYDLDPTRVIAISRKGDEFEVEGRSLELEQAIRAASAAAILAEEDHEEHRRARQETGFWGKAGAGCVVVSRSTGRILIGLRSQAVMEPGTWGTFGGAMDRGLTPELMALKELRQETGFTGAVELIPLYVFEAPAGSFRYFNFAAVVDDEFEPELNWEHSDAKWFELDCLPNGLHFGLQKVVESSESLAILRDYRPRAARMP